MNFYGRNFFKKKNKQKLINFRRKNKMSLCVQINHIVIDEKGSNKYVSDCKIQFTIVSTTLPHNNTVYPLTMRKYFPEN